MPLTMLRRHVALVTQEHHIFIGTVRDNLAPGPPEAGDERDRRALDAVDALELGAGPAPRASRTELGTTGHPVVARPGPAARAGASGAGRPPHPGARRGRPRCSTCAPRATSSGPSRPVLEGRTVIAIAHRLHTAHDADRVAVVIDGRIAELGTHDELVALEGEYASLWRSWRNEPTAPRRLDACRDRCAVTRYPPACIGSRSTAGRRRPSSVPRPVPRWPSAAATPRPTGAPPSSDLARATRTRARRAVPTKPRARRARRRGSSSRRPPADPGAGRVASRRRR